MKKIILATLLILTFSCETSPKNAVDGTNRDIVMQLDTIQDVNKKLFETISEKLKAKKALRDTTVFDSMLNRLRSELRVKVNKQKQLTHQSFTRAKANPNFETENLKVRVSDFDISDTWVFNRRGSKYSYNKVDRGNKYVTFKAKISSTDNNPMLPRFELLVLKTDSLMSEHAMVYNFQQWKDYSTYIGATSDFANDFAKTETITFTVGTSVKEEDLQRPMLILAGQQEVKRVSNKTGTPPVSYKADYREFYITTWDDLKKHGIQIVKVFPK